MAEIEGEDRLERLGPAARWRGFVEDLDTAAHEIGAVHHRPAHGHPVGGGHAIGVDEHQPRRGRLGHAAIARRRRPLLGLGDDADIREPRAHVRQRLGRAVVDHQHLAACQIVLAQRREAARQPRRVIVMRDDDRDLGHDGSAPGHQ